MPDLTWSALIALSGLVAAVVLLAMDERNRRKFQPREEAESSLKRVHRRIDENCNRSEGTVRLVASMDDRVGVLESRAERIEERQAQHFERISEQLAATARMNDQTAQRLETMGGQLQEMALRLERIYHQRGGV